MSHQDSHHTEAHTQAAHGHHHEVGPWQVIVESDLLNVVILALAIVYLGNKFLPKMVDERKKQINKELEDAKNARIKAEKELSDIKEKLRRTTAEIEQIKIDAEKTAVTIKKQMEEDTEKEIEQLKLKVKREISSNYEETIQNIKKSASDVAIKLAETALTQLSKDREVQKKLVEDFVTELKTPSKN